MLISYIILILNVSFAFSWSSEVVNTYRPNEELTLYANRMFSDKTEFPYAYNELPFVCKPEHKANHRVPLNFGSLLRGERISGADITLIMKSDIECRKLCSKTLDAHSIKKIRYLIDADYRVEWIADGLPGATTYTSADISSKYYQAGFPLGELDELDGNRNYVFYNHFTLIMRYRPMHNDDRLAIVGFEVFPKSVNGTPSKCEKPSSSLPSTNDTAKEGPLILPDPYSKYNSKTPWILNYTYSVYWIEDTSIDWNHRWDRYNSLTETRDQSSSMVVLNALGISIALLLLLFVVTFRVLRRDHSREPHDKDQSANGLAALTPTISNFNYGLNAISEDIFRTPKHFELLATAVGAGAQLLSAASITIGFALKGTFTPSYRGGLLHCAMITYAFTSIIGGMTGRYMYLLLSTEIPSKQTWLETAFMTAFAVPGPTMLLILCLDLLYWSVGSSVALPFSTICLLIIIWLFVCMPLSAFGSFIVEGKLRSEDSMIYLPQDLFPPSQLPKRNIPHSRFRIFETAPLAILCGAIAFVVIRLELYSIYYCIWTEKSSFYNSYGIMGVNAVLLFVVIMCSSALTTYLTLSQENYEWQWKSWVIGAGGSVWIFLYSIWFFLFHMHVTGTLSILVYLTSILMVCTGYALLAGCLSFVSAYIYVWLIYKHMKIA
ncbi:hypothetical protein CANCADRAFT_84424 [Tortispora caseinolytica NRRL Y-17796]|uniref:Transmembrane 9 superfamily member n=1 Tax=Tortispora caseinolytica NRRL Y-17796 TaxID=767744 RepID=A0A1E4TKI8_9ASCO|nr:hypothetical protein CANCADRAFT_84424 [Tortispora caseinolytica NRRL Y-17796]